MATMSEQTENRPLKSYAEIRACSERAAAHLKSAHEHDERARLLREQREELERRWFGRRFILIRF
jgi:hypothetical protein